MLERFELTLSSCSTKEFRISIAGISSESLKESKKSDNKIV
jgi:hypothetical protein